MESQLYRTEKVSDAITRIVLPGGVFSYLVKGTQKAALIDTGCGIGDLKGFVESIAQMPVFVLLTHGHLDHAPGAVQFQKVYMNLLDRNIYDIHSDKELRKGYVYSNIYPEDMREEDFLPQQSCDFQELMDEDRFDLGGVHIMCHSCPGHTSGSMVMLIEEERCLLLGDACNPFTFLFDASSTGVTTYENSLFRLKEKVDGKYDQILLSHGDGVPSRDMLEENIQVCQDIRKGDVVNHSFEFNGRKAYLAKEQGRVNEYGEVMANIAYDPNRIEE